MITKHGPTSIWLTFAAIGLATYLLRLSFIFLFGQLDNLPAWIDGVLRFVPPAVLAALITPAIFTFSIQPPVELVFTYEKLFAGFLATLVGWRTKNVFAIISVGMIALWVLQATL